MKFTKYIYLVVIMLVTGCAQTNHGGVIRGGDKGIQATCQGGCLVYKQDRSGCAKFADDTAKTCAAYFDKICTTNPEQCNPNKKDD